MKQNGGLRPPLFLADIEETFRDLKSHRWGYDLQCAPSRSTERLENLLLLTTLAMVSSWLVDLAAKANGWIHHFQAQYRTEEGCPLRILLGTAGVEKLKTPSIGG